MKNLYFIVSFLVLFCTSVFSQITGPKVGEIVGQMGSTFNERDGETQKVNMGYELQMKDFLQTGEDGGMIISYVDGTKFTMGPNTEKTIDEFAFDTSKVPIELAMNVTVNVGSFTYESGSVSNLGGEVNINAGFATVTVQGTAFSATVETSGVATITLLPDSDGAVGQVTVSTDAGSQTITNVYNSVSVTSNNLTPTPPKIETNKQDIIELDKFEEEIKDESIKEFGDVDSKSEKAQKMEEAIISEEASIVEDNNAIVATDMSVSEADSMIEMESKEEKGLDSTVEAEVDTSYYDEWEDDLKEWGYIDEDNQISVWDAEGEKSMDWDDAKKMYAEMDQAYFDAIGCSDCTWDSVDWDNINWDEVDWEEYDKKIAKTMESFGLEAYNYDDLDVTDDVFEDVDNNTALVEDDDYEDIDWDNYNYYEDEDGPFLITGEEDWCKEASWCDAEYVENSNKWAQADWDLNTKYDKWNSESKKLFEEVHLSWYDMDMKEAPKPWTIPALKDKYIKDWTWDDWDIWWKEFDEWYYSDYYDNWESTYEEISLEEEYAFEDDLLTAEEWEIEWLATITFEADCTYFGYYWDAANQSCGFTWVDNSEVNIKVKSSGEKINYETGEITQTITTTTDGVSDSVTRTGRYSTLNNTADVNVSTGSNNWHEYTRTHEGHTFHIHTGGSGVNSGNDAIQKFDMMVIQEQETQSVIAGSNGATITIIQTD